MAKEVKHIVSVTLKPEKGEDQLICEGELLEELPDRGRRKCMKIRITDTPDTWKLLIGQSKIIKYLPEERRDLHKEWHLWPSHYMKIIIDNGITNRQNDGNPEIELKLKSQESYIKALEHTVTEQADKLEGTGTRRDIDTEIKHISALMRSFRGMSTEEKERIIREQKEEKK